MSHNKSNAPRHLENAPKVVEHDKILAQIGSQYQRLVEELAELETRIDTEVNLRNSHSVNPRKPR